MADDPFEGLVDRIYEAAVVPERWPDVLDGLSEIADGDGALILTSNAFQERWLGTGAAAAFFQKGIEEGWQGERNPRAPRFFAARYPGFVNDYDLLTQEEIDTHPYYTEFLRPLGLGWGTATAIEVPSGDAIAFDIECRFERGPVEKETMQRLDLLRPHLARAALISSRLAFERVRTAAQTLELMGLPAGVLGSQGKLIAANGLLDAFIPRTVVDARDRLRLADEAADELLSASLSRIPRLVHDASVRSIPVRKREDLPPLVVHLVPVRGSANDLFSGASAIFVVTPVEPQKVPSAELLQGLFDLTPAEARAARGVAGGQTLDGIARAHGVSKETVRSQMKSALSKTGMRRQVDLARLLATVAPPGLGKDAV